ncbi:uncharacterized protein LOC127748873 isoform X3 [Frankliniella occidentalis]|uniref:Uncharacterized protein LOC127748873 isoform X3 n=1 Tax=Frankliniella occidentalis TaxID=133901 RepID=A0A9C6WLD0_FRAOC|nr:uncharacterized protein LOC127748873 isoform X3 [Frankliniella occidentalis]
MAGFLYIGPISEGWTQARLLGPTMDTSGCAAVLCHSSSQTLYLALLLRITPEKRPDNYGNGKTLGPHLCTPSYLDCGQFLASIKFLK